VTISPDDDIDTTKPSEGKYNSEYDSNVDIHMNIDVDALDVIDFHGDVDM